MATFDELRTELEPVLANWVRQKIDRELEPLSRELRASQYRCKELMEECDQLRAAVARNETVTVLTSE